MNCKFCNAEFDDGVLICPTCGKSQTEETAPDTPAEVEETETPVTVEESAETTDVTTEENGAGEVCSKELSDEEKQENAPKKGVWNIILSIACGVLLLGILTVALIRGGGMNFLLHFNDVQRKDSYTVVEEDAIEAANDVVATVNGKTLTNAELQAHYFGAIYQFIENYGTQYFSFDQSLDKQVFSTETGMTWQQYFLSSALTNWHRYQILTDLAAEEGFTPDLTALDALPAELEEAAKEYGFDSALDMVQADMGKACSMDAYYSYIRLLQSGNQYIGHLYEQWEPTQEDLETYFAENEALFLENQITKTSGPIVDVRHILVVPAGEKTDGEYSEKQWDDARLEAERILNVWKSGEATEKSFGELANMFSKDSGSNTIGGLYEGITPYSSYVPGFLEWSVDETREAGETGIVKTEYGYHVMYFVGGEPMWQYAARNNYKPSLLNEIVSDNMKRWPISVKYNSIIVTDANVVSDTTENSTN